jgi:hypothetical protein
MDPSAAAVRLPGFVLATVTIDLFVAGLQNRRWLQM